MCADQQAWGQGSRARAVTASHGVRSVDTAHRWLAADSAAACWCAHAGLGLYYLSNTAVTTGIQVWLRKLGGADVKVNELGPITKVGTGEPAPCTSHTHAASLPGVLLCAEVPLLGRRLTRIAAAAAPHVQAGAWAPLPVTMTCGSPVQRTRLPSLQMQQRQQRRQQRRLAAIQQQLQQHS